jgi:hypothetical protein
MEVLTPNGHTKYHINAHKVEGAVGGQVVARTLVEDIADGL